MDTGKLPFLNTVCSKTVSFTETLQEVLPKSAHYRKNNIALLCPLQTFTIYSAFKWLTLTARIVSTCSSTDEQIFKLLKITYALPHPWVLRSELLTLFGLLIISEMLEEIGIFTFPMVSTRNATLNVLCSLIQRYLNWVFLNAHVGKCQTW